MLRNDVICIPGHVQDFHRRIPGLELVRELAAIGFRHDDIRQQQFDCAAMLIANPARGFCPVRVEHRVATADQYAARDSPHGRLVLHQ